MDQEVNRIQRANDVTPARQASGQPVDAAVYAAASGGRTLWPPSSKYDVISVSRCVFYWRTVLPYFTPIRFGTTEP